MNAFPFVIIEPYQLFEGDIAFGVFSDEMQHYVLGDGDCYTASELKLIWPDAVLLTWGQLKARLKSKVLITTMNAELSDSRPL